MLKDRKLAKGRPIMKCAICGVKSTDEWRLRMHQQKHKSSVVFIEE